MQSLHNLSKGFTLIEMMIVVAIIGILAAIAIPTFNGYIRTSKDTAFTGNMDEAIRYTKNEIARSVSTGTTVTAAALVSALNAAGSNNPCQDGQPAYATSVPSPSNCFVVLEDQASPPSIVISGYDIDGNAITPANGDLLIE